MRHCWPYAYASTTTLHSRMDTLDKLKNGSTSQALIYFSDVLPFLSNASIALFASLMACEGGKVLKKMNNCFNPSPPVSANWHLYRFYSVKRQTILLVNEEPLGLTSSQTMSPFHPFLPVSANCHLYRFYSVKRQTILHVNGEPLGQERIQCIDGFQSRDKTTMLVHKTTANY